MDSRQKLFAGDLVFWFGLILTLWLLFPLTVVADQAASQDFNALRGELERLGWRVERSPAGDLLLWPPGGEDESTPAAVAIQTGAARQKAIAATDIEQLRERLAEQGWDVRQGGDGSLLLYPDTSQSDSSAPTASIAGETNRYDEVRALLSASGWRVDRDRDGTLTLYPKVGSEVNSRDTAVVQVASTDLGRVRDALLAAGWKLEEETDGTLILHPGSNVASQDRRSAVHGVSGLLLDPVASGEIELPVDSWGKANKIAGFWLEQQQRKDLNIGKIRKVNWVYLVSIVENSKPFRLNNQLAIRNRDGRVIPLY